MCPFWPLLQTEYVYPLANHPQLLYMQEKDFVDADTSQSLYELHISKVASPHFVQGWKQACAYTVERTAQCKSWVELRSYGATMYCLATCLELNWFCSSRSFPASRSSAATFDHLTWLALPSTDCCCSWLGLAGRALLALDFFQMWGETPLPSITILTNGFNLPDIPLKLDL